MIYNIQVTQEHINKANKGSYLMEEQTQCCPIAIALFEQIIGGTTKLGNRNYTTKIKRVVFNHPTQKNCSNMFSVANTILWKGWGLPNQKHIVPPVTIPLNADIKKWIIAYDKGEKVEPFSFSFDFPIEKV